MEGPNFSQDQFVDSSLLNLGTGQLLTSIQEMGSGAVFFVAGVVNPSSLSFVTPGNLTVTVNAPSPFKCLFGTGAYMGAHGVTNGVDSSSYTLDFTPFVSPTLQVTAYIVATSGTILLTPVQIIGPPPGHPDFNAAFIPYNGYTQLQYSLNISVTTTPPDNIINIELGRVALYPGITVINTVDKSHQVNAHVVLPPLGGASGDISGILPGPLTVTGIQNHPFSATAPQGGQIPVFTSGVWTPSTLPPVVLPAVTWTWNNLRAINNPSNPTTQINVSADQVICVVPNFSTAYRKTTFMSTVDITKPISSWSPALGTRDRSTPFPNGFIHIYAISNGTTFGLIASLNLPSVGPTLPSGYTSWAYVGAWLIVSADLARMYINSNKAYYQTNQIVVNSSATPNVEHTQSVANVVPTNAYDYSMTSTVTNEDSNTQQSIHVRLTSGLDFLFFEGGDIGGFPVSSFYMIVPNVNTQTFIWMTGLGGAQLIAFYLNSFTIPNHGN